MKAQFVEILNLPKTKAFPKDIHSQYEFPTASQAEVESKYQNFLKFAILRNPWERLYSCYTNKIEKGSSTGPDFILECSADLYLGMPFEDFVDVVCNISDSVADYHFCSQIYLLTYPDGNFPINYLCNIENLTFHLDEIKEKTGIPFTSGLKLNSSKKSNYTEAYSDGLIEKVRNRYKMDIELFDYKFGKTNNTFPFGLITTTFEKRFSDSAMMIQLLKEKNRELSRAVELKNAPLLQKMSNLTRASNILQADYNALINSLSWKLTSPVRQILSIFK